MDTAYNYQSPYKRQSNRSLQHLNHLSLAPLSLRMPLIDPESLPELSQQASNLKSHSAQATPSINSRPPHSPSRNLSKPGFPKSKSSTYLTALRKAPNFVMTPGDSKLQQTTIRDELRLNSLGHGDWNDSDWFLRTGEILASSARESKGQAWLVSRASSTSLAGLQDDDYKELKQDNVKETEVYSRRSGIRGSVFGAFDGDFTSPQTSISSIDPTSRRGSQPTSRLPSRVMSRCGSRAQLFSSPMVVESDSYFDYKTCCVSNEEFVTVPSFLSIEADYDEEVELQDEATIRKLARDYSQGLGGWVERILGWKLLTDSGIGENDSVIECKDEGENTNEDCRAPSRTSFQTLDVPTHAVKIDLPPPENGEISFWQDAAWILSVAAKVLF